MSNVQRSPRWRARSSATTSCFSFGAGFCRHPGAGGEHRLQRLPDPRVDPGRDGYLPASSAAAVIDWCSAMASSSGGTGVVDLEFRRLTSRLIQLYIIGVRLLYAQPGRDGAALDCLSRTTAPEGSRLRRARLINVVALLTGLVVVVVLITKFTHAYLVVIAMPVLFALMKAMERHYRHVGEEQHPVLAASRRRGSTPLSCSPGLADASGTRVRQGHPAGYADGAHGRDWGG